MHVDVKSLTLPNDQGKASAGKRPFLPRSAATEGRKAAFRESFPILDGRRRTFFRYCWPKRKRNACYRKIRASYPGESCICFPLCIILPRGLRTVFLLTRPPVRLYFPALRKPTRSPTRSAVSLILRKRFPRQGWGFRSTPLSSDVSQFNNGRV